MADHHKRRILMGVGANSVNQLVNIIFQLITVPLLIRYWGTGAYGEWITLSAIPAYLAMSDLGFAGVTGTEMVMNVARGDREGALGLFQSAWLFVTAVSTALSLLAAGMVVILPIEEILNIKFMNIQESKQILMILLFYVWLTLQDGLMGSGFRCTGHYSTHVWCATVVRLAESSAIILGVMAGATPVFAAVIMVSISLIGLIAKRIVMRVTTPWLTYGSSHARLRSMFKFSTPALSGLGFPIGHILSVQGMIILINITLGPTAVAIFSTQRTLSRSGFQAMNIINLSVRPEMSAAYGAGDMGMAKRLHRGACQMSLWLSLAIVLALAITGRSIIAIWTRGKIDFDPFLFGLLLAQIVVNAAWYTSSVVGMATNRHQKVALSYIAGNVIALSLAAALIPHFGLSGVAVSLLALDSVMTLIVLSQSIVQLDDNPADFLHAIVQPPSMKKLFFS